MKNIISIAILVLSVSFFSACDDDWNECYRGNGILGELEVNIDHFETLEINSSIDVELVADTVNMAIISGDDNIIDLVNTRVIGNRLTVDYRHDINCVRTSHKTVIELHYTNLKEILIDGSGDVYGIDTLFSDRLDVKINGSGNVSLIAKVENLFVEVDGSGDVAIDGKGAIGYVLIDGSGNVDMLDFEIESLGIEVSGSGSTRAYVQDELQVWINGSGDVLYRGEAMLVIEERNGSGDVRKI